MMRLVPGAGHNAQLLGGGQVRIRLGKSYLDIIVPADADAGLKPSAELSFTIRPEPLFLGQRATLSAAWQDVPAGVFQLNAFGPTRIRVPINNFVSPSRLMLRFECERNEAFYGGDFDAFTTDCATVGEFEIEPLRVGSDNRFALIAAARAVAAEFGLRGEFFTPERAEALAATVVAALRERRGFSMVRVGDAEGKVLSYPLYYNDLEILSQILHYQFGPESMAVVKAAHPEDWVASAMRPLQAMLQNSLRNADALGLPVYENVSEQAFAREPYGALGYAGGLLATLGLAPRVPPELRFGVNVFGLAASRGPFFRDISHAAKAVYLVGPWDLSEPFAQAVGLEKVHHIRVPGHYTWRGNKGFGQIPELYRFVEARIAAAGDLSGCLLLVGGGVVGKHYCNLIKTRGGVALDVGSVFDSWAGRGRPEAVQSKHVSLERLRELSA